MIKTDGKIQKIWICEYCANQYNSLQAYNSHVRQCKHNPDRQSKDPIERCRYYNRRIRELESEIQRVKEMRERFLDNFLQKQPHNKEFLKELKSLMEKS